MFHSKYPWGGLAVYVRVNDSFALIEPYTSGGGGGDGGGLLAVTDGVNWQ